MTALLQDLRYGWRVLRKSPGFTAVAVLVLALGIGANTAIFSVVNSVLIRPLPFKDPTRLMQIWHVPPPKSFPGMTMFAVSAANYLDWKHQNHVFESMAIYTFQGFDLTGGDKPESVLAAAVEPTFFSVLGSQPLLGRTFVFGEEEAGRDNIVVLSYGFWQTRFGGNPAIIGQTITLNHQPRTVIGVMGPKFARPYDAKIWVPLAWTAEERAVRGEHHYSVIARLRPDVTLSQAQAEMNTISRRLAQQYPEDDKDWGAVVLTLREELVGDVRPSLLILLGAVAFVLLIA
jgi:putative ABC transport system permease protein